VCVVHQCWATACPPLRMAPCEMKFGRWQDATARGSCGGTEVLGEGVALGPGAERTRPYPRHGLLPVSPCGQAWAGKLRTAWRCSH
jgi:hypothetical protein